MADHRTGTVDHPLIDQAMPNPDHSLKQLVPAVPAQEAFDAVPGFDPAEVRQPAVTGTNRHAIRDTARSVGRESC